VRTVIQKLLRRRSRSHCPFDFCNLQRVKTAISSAGQDPGRTLIGGPVHATVGRQQSGNAEFRIQRDVGRVVMIGV